MLKKYGKHEKEVRNKWKIGNWFRKGKISSLRLHPYLDLDFEKYSFRAFSDKWQRGRFLNTSRYGSRHFHVTCDWPLKIQWFIHDDPTVHTTAASIQNHRKINKNYTGAYFVYTAVTTLSDCKNRAFGWPQAKRVNPQVSDIFHQPRWRTG